MCIFYVAVQNAFFNGRFQPFWKLIYVLELWDIFAMKNYAKCKTKEFDWHDKHCHHCYGIVSSIKILGKMWPVVVTSTLTAQSNTRHTNHTTVVATKDPVKAILALFSKFLLCLLDCFCECSWTKNTTWCIVWLLVL